MGNQLDNVVYFDKSIKVTANKTYNCCVLKKKTGAVVYAGGRNKLKKNDMEKFKKRAVKYLDIIEFGDWKFKLYSMKYNELRVTPEIAKIIKTILPDWVKEKSQINDYPNYKIGTVIIHEAMDNILVVVNWWVYENVIQNYVYCSEYEHPDKFVDLTSKGLRFCVWEMNILWHERNLWVKHVLDKADKPDWNSYLNHYYELDYAD